MNKKNNKHIDPPEVSLRFFRWFCRPEIAEDIEGDLHENFQRNIEDFGLKKAKWKFTTQILKLFRPGIVREFPFKLFNTQTMWRHNLLISWRIMLRNKGFSLINMGGLILGLTMAMFITLWIKDELSYDRFHLQGDRIFQVKRHVYSGDGIHTTGNVTYNIAEDLRTSFPEVQNVAVISPPVDLVINRETLSTREEGIYAEPSFFDLFTWPVIAGDPKNLLTEPNSIVISEDLARRYFGSAAEDLPALLGTSLKHNITGMEELKITGIIKNIPQQSTLQFNFVIPFENYRRQNGWLSDWNNSGIRIYAVTGNLQEGEELSSKIIDLQNHHIDNFRSDLFLQPLFDVHLHNQFRDGIESGGRIEYIRIFILVAFMIILIACINFVNLSTARASQRGREIGVRKTIGASKNVLVTQFIGESGLIIVIAFLLALGVFFAGLPGFNLLTGKALQLADIQGQTLLLFLGIGVLTAVLASFYPAFYLSAFTIIQVLKSGAKTQKRDERFRKGLVVFQFMMSSLLIIGTITIYRQMQYIRHKNLGLDRSNVIQIRLEDEMNNQYSTIRQELLKNPAIEAVSSAGDNPLQVGSNTHSVQWRGKIPNSQISMSILSVNYDFLDVMQMKLASGRDFQIQFGNDSSNYLINETAQRIMGFEDPLGEELSFWGNTGKIVGIVHDFNMSSLYSEIEPTILILRPDWSGTLFVRTRTGKTQEAIGALEELSKKINPTYPFEYTFLDESFEEMYRSEATIGDLSLCFTGFALFIASLGLLGLAIFSGQQRIKEISIRKVLGARMGHLILILCREFLLLIIIALVLVIPISYFLMSRWLNNFAYHAELDSGVFLFAAGLTLMTAALTVGFYSIKLVSANPIDSLKSE